MPAPTTKSEPAEGARADEATSAGHATDDGVSAQTPAEGSDDLPAELAGSPRG